LAGQLPQGDPAPLDGTLPDSAKINSDVRTFHAYLHVPFCRVRCGYCDFNTYTSSELKGFKPSDFVGNLRQELAIAESVLKSFEPRELKTVFFGGGTPTQLPASDLVASLAALRSSFGIAQGAEVTTEANPDTVDVEYLKELAEGGFNRVSLGMQSAVPSVLATLEREHTPANVPLAVKAAKDNGLDVSVDLIYGAPGETMDDWKRSVEVAVSLETSHISAYALIVEDGTKLARQIKSGALTEPDEDLEAEKYEYADDAFKSAGFEWYELSNWSKSTDTRSAHNIAYWQGMDWWGFGPGAHSHVGGVRWWNVKHPTAYAARLEDGNSPAAGRETIDASTALTERVLLEVRLREGIDVTAVKALNPNANQAISQLIADGNIDGAAALRGRIVLTLRGRLLADAVVRELVG
jgi:oxygen-independent coproporphyrinogen-3 oxidase